MHLIWENLLKNLILHWTGEFKGLDDGTESYELEKTMWRAIGEATARTGSMVPSAYGARVPNIAADGVYISAEMWSFWALYLGPVLLRQRFKAVRYYDHFIRLVKLLNICLQFEISDNEIKELQSGFALWVQDYERIYYQHDYNRLSTCPLTVHALLHIADSIKATGPVWCYWAFPMERYCGTIQPAIHSRRHPFASLARHVLEDAQLTQIKIYYDVVDELSLRPSQRTPAGSLQIQEYPTCRLLPPKAVKQPTSLAPVYGALVTRLQHPLGTVKRYLQNADIIEWGKVQRIDSDAGDTMRASELGTIRDDSRDASWVRYEMLVDRHARRRNAAVNFVREMFYGQLQHIYVIHFGSPCLQLGLEDPETTFILAAIRSCKCIESEQIRGLDIHFYNSLGQLHVIDITAIQCLVGRVPCGENKWAVIDRSGTLARAVVKPELEFIKLEEEHVKAPSEINVQRNELKSREALVFIFGL
ncbi:uncharacterized protein EV420DRAFT_1620490 [Desarmillaria tabescens]|uniref:DUF4218 domain-containing protein n=1 Tax=Armillaria tabescens TaxID=1929756 RepID=A0AA39KFA2_ARMTA|nr:uncharacterized protein EV420DRAFT_1620490 [Desarmillaria tabescens]KAK0458724.1 hypothetical protein EV420DRAFT_1620490 [Desarmillaria tabescens]